MKILSNIVLAVALLFASLAVQLHGQTVIWLESDFESPRLVKTEISGSQLEKIPLPPGTLPQALAVNWSDGTFYTAGLNFETGGITSVNSDFNSVANIIANQSALRGIAIDTAANTIYWTSTNLIQGAAIWRGSLSDTTFEVLLQFKAGSRNSPRAICLDPENNTMYWTNFGQGKIQKAEMSKNAAIVDLVSGLKGPSGLAMDADSGKIFWTELYGHQIKSADLNGENEAVLVSEIPYPNYIAVNGKLNKMAWSELGTGKIKSANLDGTDVFEYNVKAVAPSGIVIQDVPVSEIAENSESQNLFEFALHQNYPNPFNPVTKIEYSLKITDHVNLDIFNALGQKVRGLVSAQQNAGKHSVNWDATNNSGKLLPSGIYYYKIQTGQFSAVKKMILLK